MCFLLILAFKIPKEKRLSFMKWTPGRVKYERNILCTHPGFKWDTRHLNTGLVQILNGGMVGMAYEYRIQIKIWQF